MKSEIIKRRGYDENIAGSELSLEIASYPTSARYLAERLKDTGNAVCELCCGVGISLIEMAEVFPNIIGVDNDRSVVEACAQNLKRAGINNFKLIHGDASEPKLLRGIEGDVVIYDIPFWSDHNGQTDTEKNPDLISLIENIRELITRNIVIYTPPYVEYDDILKQFGECEFTEVYLDGRHDRNFVFLGNTIKETGHYKIEL